MEFEDVKAKMAWEVGREALRVAAAFGVKTFEKEELPAYDAIRENRVVCHYKGLSGTVLIEWVLDKRSGRLESIEIGAYDACYLMRLSHNKWRYRAHAVFSQQLVTGLYSMGFDEPEALQQLPQLTAHEQLECRLALPRELWPQKWLEQEAEPLVVKLTRIWSALAPFVMEVGANAARFVAPLSQDVELRVDVLGSLANVLGSFSHYYLYEIGSDLCILGCDDKGDRQSFLPYVWDWTPVESLRPRQSKWMDSFRRGCWLSGCAIEATAHEKAEWVQGFTREEIDAWNLKI